MSLQREDFEPFIGRWMKIGTTIGEMEGMLAEVGERVLTLSPVVAVLRRRLDIFDHQAVLPIDLVTTFRAFPRALSEELIAETNAEQARSEAAQRASATSSRSGWGNPL